MAVAKAQHMVAELVKSLQAQGVQVQFSIQ